MPFPLMFAAATAVALVPAEPAGGSYTAPDDYPSAAWHDHKTAAGIFRVLIDPSGKAMSCNLDATIGDGSLAASICPLVQRRSFTPARDAGGRAVYGLVIDVVNFWTPGEASATRFPLKRKPDAVFTLSAFPSGVVSPTEGVVGVAVGPDGKVQQCSSVGLPGKAAPLLVAACQQFIGRTVEVARTPTGAAVPYVGKLTVRFVVGAAKPGTP